MCDQCGGFNRSRQQARRVASYCESIIAAALSVLPSLDVIFSSLWWTKLESTLTTTLWSSSKLPDSKAVQPDIRFGYCKNRDASHVYIFFWARAFADWPAHVNSVCALQV